MIRSVPPALRLACAWSCLLAAGAPPSAAVADAVKLRPVGTIYLGADDARLGRPQGVGCAEGFLAVADTEHGRVLTYSIGADSVTPHDTLSIPEVSVPLRVERRSSGELLVLDGRSRRIARIGASGALVGFLEPRAEGLGTVEARSFAVGREDRVLLLDVAGWRVLVLDAGGAVERSIALGTDVGFPSDVAIDGRGDVYVVDSVARRVLVARGSEPAFAPLGPTLEEDVDFPTSIAVDAEGRLFLADEHGGGIVVLGRDGAFRGRPLTSGWKPGFVRYPSDVCIDPRGRLFVAERGNDRVQIFEIR